MEQTAERVSTESLPDWVGDVVDAAARQLEVRGEPVVWRLSGSSNDLLRLSFGTDRELMVKRGRYEWIRSMFESAEVASDLLHRNASIRVPRPLSIGKALPDPVQAYWRIALPTLGDLWPSLDDSEREGALHGLGRLLRRVHRIPVPGWGDLLDPEPGRSGLEEFLRRELVERLLPPVRAGWAAAVPALERLAEALPAVLRAHESDTGMLTHGDVHLHNVLCRVEGGSASCVGLLDLDNAHALPPEADLARFRALHGPLFEQRLPERSLEAVERGYGRSIDRVLLRFFESYHLSNLGFHAAHVGDRPHADRIARALTRSVHRLRSSLADREAADTARPAREPRTPEPASVPPR